MEQVKSQCSDDIPIPSVEWVRLQFWPKTPCSKASLHYTGRLKVKFMIQQRQWRREHVDSHYAAAYFRYMREYAIMMREYCLFVCLDDKHKVKIGEPDFPVTSAERGRRVPVRADQSFQAGDHDFTKFGIVPSVALVIDIPEEISGSWYAGDVFVILKDSVFEPSSPLRHACELYHIIKSDPVMEKPVLFVYSDGGSDHRLTYLSVQISLICLFLNLDLDILCAGRTAPYHSWRNPVERIMAVLNLGLQCVAIARAQMSTEFEAEVSKCNSLADLRKIAERKEEIRPAVAASLSPVKRLLSDIFSRLTLKDKHINVIDAAEPDEICSFWSSILSVDATLKQNEKLTRDNITDYSGICEFIEHCCRIEHYSFDILKCGHDNCKICKPIKLPPEVFSRLKHLPHPTPGEDNHYLPFSEAYNLITTGEHRPSLKKRKSKSKSLPFYASVQHVKNIQMMVQCDLCGMWRLLLSKYKVKMADREYLQRLLDNQSYSCGSISSKISIYLILLRMLKSEIIIAMIRLKNYTIPRTLILCVSTVERTSHSQCLISILNVKSVHITLL